MAQQVGTALSNRKMMFELVKDIFIENSLINLKMVILFMFM